LQLKDLNIISELLPINPIFVFFKLTGIMSYILLKIIEVTIGLCTTEHDERIGLDLSDHSETVYTFMD